MTAESPVAPWYKLGDVVPHLHTDLLPYQFYKVAPDGVMLVTTPLSLRDYTVEAVEEQVDTFWERVDLLGAQKVDRVVWGGVPVAAAIGRPRMLEVLREMTARTGLPADNDMEAHVRALQHLGAEKIALATRWSDDVTQAVASYLGHAGIEVVSRRSVSRSLADNKRADPAADHALLLELGGEALRAHRDAQALLLPGGLGFVVYAAATLERRHDVPALTNVVSTLWSALRDWQGPLPHRPQQGWSRLLQDLD